MNRKTLAATDVRWFGSSSRLEAYLFGKEVTFYSSQNILTPPESPLPNRPYRPWLRLLVTQDPYADLREEAFRSSSTYDFNWVDIYGESYSFREKKLVISWSTRWQPPRRTELTFPTEKTEWQFDRICERFLKYAIQFDPDLEKSLELIKNFHIRPHPDNRYTNGQQILLFVGGLWLSYHCHTQLLTEKIEYLGRKYSSYPTLRPIYREAIFTDLYLRRGAIQRSSGDLLVTCERKTQ